MTDSAQHCPGGCHWSWSSPGLLTCLASSLFSGRNARDHYHGSETKPTSIKHITKSCARELWSLDGWTLFQSTLSLSALYPSFVTSVCGLRGVAWDRQQQRTQMVITRMRMRPARVPDTSQNRNGVSQAGPQSAQSAHIDQSEASIQVTWSDLTNKRPVFRSQHDQTRPIRGLIQVK